MNGDLPKRSKYSGDFSERIAGLSPAKRALLERRLNKSKGPAVKIEAILPRQGSEDAPLSFAQQRLWFLDKYEPNSPAYNISKVFQLKGSVNVTALKEALKTIVDRHEVLRTTFDSIDGKPVQVIQENHSAELPIIDISNVSLDDRDAEVQALLSDEVQRTFDFSSDVMLRSTLIKLNSEEHLLLIVIHHIATDGWSMGILWQELSALYNAYCVGSPSPLPGLPIQYADFAVWQRERFQGEGMENQLSYWKTCLKGAPGILELPTDHPRPSIQTYRGAQESFTLPRDLTSSLKNLCKSERVTLFMILLSAFKVLLYRYTDQKDIQVGTPIANRNQTEIEGLIGFFVNTLVLRTDLSGNLAFKVLLKKVRNVCLDAYAHQDLPFERLVEELQPQRDLSHSPLFQVMFVLQNTPRQTLELSELTLSPFQLGNDTSKFDMSLEIIENEELLSGQIRYSTDLFDQATIKRMATHFQVLLEGIVSNPDQILSELPILTQAEQHQLLVEWNDTGADYPKNQCLHELFEAQVERTPDVVAVVFEQQQLTYRELNLRANQLAHYLRKQGVGPEVLVGICVERSLEMIVGLLGILKAGGAYVPLDPEYPKDRLAFMLEDSQAPVLLTQEKLTSEFQNSISTMCHIICLDSEWKIVSQESKRNPLSGVTAKNIAYVIYTSGSTGKPKGVVIPHQAICNHMFWMLETFSLNQTDKVLQKTPFSFDASVWEFYAPLLAGAQLVMAQPGGHQDSEYLINVIMEQKITILHLVPSLLQLLLEQEKFKGCHSLQRVLCGGEALAATLQGRFFKKNINAELHNFYGPTEASITTVVWRCSRDGQSGIVPIGRPITNTQTYILNSYLSPVPVGIPGELHLGGNNLGRGYVNRPELTAERFIPNPFNKDPEDRLYKTGDLARYLPDGNIEFLGRIDHQVKIRGFRIELGEIEAVLNQHPAVLGTVAVVREDWPGDKRLAAYIVSNSEQAVAPNELRSFLKAKLPDYMVPSSFVMMDALPLTPNGKVDRKALPAPDQTRSELDETLVAPRTLVEETLAEIWVEILRVERIGIHDNFFDLGGHSLIATQVMSKLRDAFNVDLPLRTLFEKPTVAGMSLEVTRHQTELAKPEKAILPRDNHSAPLSFSQERLWFLDKYKPNSSMYNISKVYQLKGVLDVTALDQAIAAIIERHEVLQTTFPSVDGNAVQLISKNNPLGILKMIDLSDLPDRDQERKVHEIIKKENQRSFDLAADPMLRATLLQLDPETQVLLLVIHHIAFDGWSEEIFRRELSILYEAFSNQKTPPLPNLAIQYADYSAWQHSWLSGEVLQSQLSYWRKQLDGAETCLELPTDYPRPATQTFRGQRHPVLLSRSLTQSLETLSKQEGTTLFMTLVAAFQTLLYRHTGQDDLIVGIPIAGRDKTETEALIGLFVNTLAIRTFFPDKLTFNELLQEVRETALEAYAHQAFPFEKLVQDLQSDRDPSRPPLVQVMFAFQNTPKRDLMLPGLTVNKMEFDSGTVRFDLEFFMWEEQDTLRGSFVYNADLFNAATMERMDHHFQMLLEGIVANPQQRISDLPLLGKVEKHQIQVEWNETNTTYPQDLCIHQLFDIQAEKTPDAIALEFGEDSLSYRELSRRSNQLAHYLRSAGIGPDVLVGICMERSIDMVIGTLGILKSGGAYVPLDPSYPEERLAYMLEESATPVLLTQNQLLGRMPNPKGKIFCLDSDWESIAHLSEISPSFKMTQDNLAYVIYTSGSTGHPKGTCVPHRAINRLVLNTNYITLTPADRIAQASNSSFDAATFEIWGALLNGACLVGMMTDELLSPQEFSVKIREKKITTLFLTTALFNQLAAYAPQSFSSLNHLLFGGEAVDPKWVKEVLKHGAPGRLVHVYGPTENTTFSTWHLVENVSEDDTTIPIGKPVSNTQCYIFDKHMQTVPVGISGELCLGGDGLARGYYKRPELTKAKFVPNPFGETSGSNLYKTGDLVRYLPDGNIEFLGRIDDQVKLRGFRIELSEIETIMSQYSCVANVAVIMREDRPGDKKLVAYFVPKEHLEYDMADLRTFLSKKLPGYMIPQHFVALEKFPITANGKVDRKALPVPQAAFSHEQGFVAPRTEIEAKLAEIWQELIGINRISVNENFFVIGGHSLLAVRLFSKLSHLFGIDLPLATLFETPTIEGLAQRVEASIKKTSRIKRIFKIFQKTPILEITATDKGAYTHLVAIQPNGNRPPLFCMHAVGGNVLQYYYFVDELGPDQPLYGLQSLGLDGMSEPYKDIETMAVNYIKEMRQVQPHGPYFVGGGSMGGLIALEVAQQLKQDGEEIALLAMFDTFAPSYFDPEGYKPRKLFSKNWIENFLPNHIQELRKQSLKGQIIYGYNRISGLIRHRFKFFVCFFYHRIRRPLPHSIRYWYVENKNRRPAFVYTAKTYDGNLTLFSDSRNAGVEEEDMEKGWRDFISGDIEVVGIPAKHFEFIEEPILATKLKICLERAQKNIK